MSDNSVGSILKRTYINVNNVNKLNDNNGKNKYALNRDKFIPNTEEAQLAEALANYFTDLENYAFYFSVVKKLGIMKTNDYFASIKDEITTKKDTKYAVRSPKKYFAWKYKKRLY